MRQAACSTASTIGSVRIRRTSSRAITKSNPSRFSKRSPAHRNHHESPGMFDFSFLLDDGYLPLLRDGVLTTLRLFVVSGLCAIVTALVLATLRALPIKACRAFVIAVVEYHRNVPMLV